MLDERATAIIFYFKTTFGNDLEMLLISYGYVYTCSHSFSFRAQLKSVASSTPEKTSPFPRL